MRALILLTLVLGLPVGAAQVYRWVDNDGVVHFSDRPTEGADQVNLPDAQTFSTPKSQSQPSRRSGQSTSEPQQESASAAQSNAGVYEALEITSPKAEEVLYNVGGEIRVAVRTEPELQRGHSLLIFLDDQMVKGLSGEDNEFRLSEVYRGQHQLRAEIRDSRGGILATSLPLTFTVQQTSIQNPNNPNAAQAAPGSAG